ncbi:hypothetical protein Tco_1074899 [Tanacetum coccineum]
MVVQRSQETFQAMSLNEDNFLDWENKLRTWLSVCGELEFIDVPHASRCGMSSKEDGRFQYEQKFMDKLHGMISEFEMNQTSSTVNILCKDCGKGKMHELHERGILMNKVKFETYEAMDC